MLLPLVLATAVLAAPAASAAPAPAPVAGRCAYGLGVIVIPPGIVDVYKYRFLGGGLQQGTKLATAIVRGGTLSPACDRVKALAPPARPRGLAGPWPRRVASRVYCPEGGTVQIRPIVSKRRVVGTRLLVMRKDVETGNHPLDGRHVIVDVQLRPRTGGVWFDPAFCDRSSIQ
jgi:hypothetical protein